MDFSCLHGVGICRWQGQSDDRHADVFNCSRSQGAGERRQRRTDRKKGRDRQRERGRNEEKMLMLFNSLLHCHWQRDLHHCSDRCTVMNLALGEIDGVPSSHIPKIVTFCLFFFLVSPFFPCSFVCFVLGSSMKKLKQKKGTLINMEMMGKRYR